MNIGAFINKWRGVTGGQERANYGQFINDFCQALGLPLPQPAAAGVLGDYQFEGPVQGGGAGGNTGAIDLYKKGHFILEAKQSKLSDAQKQQSELFDVGEDAPASPSGARYDRLMRDALAQAKRYAVNLPSNHPWPPFLIVCDVGRAFEVYFDYSGNGRGYGYFPDQQSYRFDIARFTGDDVQEIFRAIWTNPSSIDPRAKSAEVSRGIAKRLADVSQWLESTQRLKTSESTDSVRSLAIEETALFLMRVIFCMFAEDVGLLPKKSFTAFLEKTVENEAAFEPELAQLWQVMGRADGIRYASAIGGDVRYFNGGLFASSKTYSLSNADRGELVVAAKADWTKVEPAIFGTLLEQALTPGERAKLGAHYTPRPYVERLVQATIMDVLDGEWEGIVSPSPLVGEDQIGGRAASAAPKTQTSNAPAIIPSDADASGPHPIPPHRGEGALSLEAATNFHTRLASLRILDPACGTGNFLYVAMENLMRLESDVIETIRQLGGHAEPKVGPQQFLGLELNPRAAVIAELVLWIGWLRWRMKNDPDAAPQPVLKQFGNINFGGHAGYDAVLRHKPTGEADTENPMIPDWPEADFIIGNPPFIGKGSMMRSALGDDYAEALWKANPRVPKSADFVMQWWDRAAHILVAKNSPLIRFGFVTTNSITQTFSRRVIEGYLSKNPPRNGEGDHEVVEGAHLSGRSSRADSGDPSVTPSLRSGAPPPRAGEDRSGLSLILAIPDHPWTKSTKDAAAVRIAMTVAKAGAHDGTLVEIVREQGLQSDNPVLEERSMKGLINPDLTVGADVTASRPLKSNDGLSCNGMMLAGRGFRVKRNEAMRLIELDGEDSNKVIRPFLGGSDLTQRSGDEFVIDFAGLDEKSARQKYRAAYQHLYSAVKPERDRNADKAFREKWWLFGRVRPELRAANVGLRNYIATTETTKHRVFQFVDTTYLPGHMIIAIGSDDAFHLGVLSSRVHTEWVLASCSWLGVGNDSRYTKSQCFDPFPFPDPTPDQRAIIAELAEELDETRKAALAEVAGLTMTEIYNWRDKLRNGTALDFIEQARAAQARAGIVNRLHEQLDAAVAEAYGWPADLSPSEIVTRLVALNAERAKEEAEGKIRWLRPEYQIPRFGLAKKA
ncbi:MAG: DNA methyltransferase [Sphingorhabdus sp.]